MRSLRTACLLVLVVCAVSGCTKGPKENAEPGAVETAKPTQPPAAQKATPEKEQGSGATGEQNFQDPESMPQFASSLHKTGEGMRYWYEEHGGAMEITGIPYQKLGCKSCHSTSCGDCHAEGEGENKVYSLETAQKKETCLKCHVRAKKAFSIDGERDALDVHIAADMNCSDCHTSADVHGDGKAYHSMRSPGAVKTDCQDCHHEDSEDAPAFTLDSRSHKKHSKDLHCSACHVRSTMACMNCHFSEFLRTKTKAGNSIPVKDWMVLLNYEDKVTAGTAMTLVHEDKKFVTYAPYFTHSVMADGRKCEDCHGTENARLLQEGKTLVASWFEAGKISFVKGVIPLLPDQVEWTYLDKKDGEWVPLESDKVPVVQMSGFGAPLTKTQIKKLSRKIKSR